MLFICSSLVMLCEQFVALPASGISNSTKASVVVIYPVIKGSLFTCGPQFMMRRIYARVMVLRVVLLKILCLVIAFFFFVVVLDLLSSLPWNWDAKISSQNPRIFSNVQIVVALVFFLIVYPISFPSKGVNIDPAPQVFQVS